MSGPGPSPRSKVVISQRAILDTAVEVASESPCAKSKRGVVIWLRSPMSNWKAGVYGEGFNAPPLPFACDESASCREACSKVCVHAEAQAILGVRGLIHQDAPPARFLEMLHIKVVDGRPVPSGPPSCWQCSRHILGAGIGTMWLLSKDGFQSYTAAEFHHETLKNCGLPVHYEPS